MFLVTLLSPIIVGVLFCLTGPATAPASEELSVAAAAATLLDDNASSAVRNAAIDSLAEQPGPLIAEMVKGLGDDSAEEYRRIPWIWRVAVAAGKRNRPEQLRAVLDVSLPQPGERLRDWQAVVIGGGVINGLTLAGEWPEPRIARLIGPDARLRERWAAALQASATLADDEQVTRGTRYDALRMLALRGWDASGAQLQNYLAKGTHAELQMGAVSGCGDIDDERAARALVDALTGLDPRNVRLAVTALRRNAERKALLDEAVADGRISNELLNTK